MNNDCRIEFSPAFIGQYKCWRFSNPQSAQRTALMFKRQGRDVYLYINDKKQHLVSVKRGSLNVIEFVDC